MSIIAFFIEQNSNRVSNDVTEETLIKEPVFIISLRLKCHLMSPLNKNAKEVEPWNGTYTQAGLSGGVGAATPPPNVFASFGKSESFSYYSLNSAIFSHHSVTSATVLYQVAVFSV